MVVNLSCSPPSSFSLIKLPGSKSLVSVSSLNLKTLFSKSHSSSVSYSFSSSDFSFKCRNQFFGGNRYPDGRTIDFRSWAIGGIDFGNAQSVLEASAVLTAIIIVHEGGHFLAAYLQGIRVSKFAVGFGPILAKFNSNNVEYSIRAFPLGGFVGFPDNDPDSDFPVDDVNLLKNRPILDRFIVISAGVVANIIFAYFIVFIQVISVGLPVQEAYPGVLVPEVRSFSAASRDGLLPGDIILAVDGNELPKVGSIAVSELVDYIKKNPRKNLLIKIERGQKDFEIGITPDEYFDGTGKIGVQLSPNVKVSKAIARNLAEAFTYTGKEFWGLSSNIVDNLKQTFLNFSQSASKVSGPVAIIAVGAEVARSNIEGLYQFAAVLNLNLAIINLLPLPALDGGSLALILVEAANGSRTTDHVLWDYACVNSWVIPHCSRHSKSGIY